MSWWSDVFEAMAKDVEIKVEPYASLSYAIYYKCNARYNTQWELLTEVVDFKHIPKIEKFFPVLYDDFESACVYAKQLKSDPTLISKHNARQKQRYLDLKPKIEEYAKIPKVKRQAAIF